MRRLLTLASLAAAALVATSAPASADGWNRHHRESRSSVGIYFGVPGPHYYAHPYYYRPYYEPRTVVVERPVYYSAPPVYAAPPAGITLREGRDSAGNYCREYQSNTSIDGRPVMTYGTACLRPDGSWQIVN